ncbi:MAG: hypothetical protein FJ088_11940, partial [Deltaproteobacteria bacterium]|nr:hypothetical protein [Deltaproteobacteria bacterium]
EIPICWFYPWYSGGIFECVSEKIKTRSAFLKVDSAKEKAYASEYYSDKDMERFGYFRTERQKYDPNYGSTYSGVIRKINRFNIWQEYKFDGSGNIDYKNMTPKPIVYYLNEKHPRDLVQAGVDLVMGWANPFNETAEYLTGKKLSDFGLSDMFVLCENNLAEYDKAKADGLTTASVTAPCDVTETPKRNGDLRYNFLYAVTDPTVVGLYGYGPSSADPLTGEIISSAAYNYVAAMRRGANKAASMIELLAGVKLFREITEADYIALKKYDRLEELGWKSGYTNEEAQKLAESFVKPEVSEALSTAGIEKSDLNYAQARLNIIAKNPSYEAMMIDDDIKLLFKDPRVGEKHASLTESQLQKYSLRSWAHHGGFKQLMNYYKFLSKRCLYMEDFLDNALISLANHYKKVYDDAMCGTFKDREDLSQMFDFSQFSESIPCTTAKLVEQMRVYMKKVNQTNPYSYDKYIGSPLYVNTFDPVLAKGQQEVLDLLGGLREQVVEEIYQKLYKGIAEHEVGH